MSSGMTASLQATGPSLPPPLHPKADGDFALVTIAIAAVFIGAVCSTFLVVALVRFLGFRRMARAEAAEAESAIRFRNLLLEAGSEAIVALASKSQPAFSTDHANMMLHQVTSGPDARRVAHAVEQLVNQGNPFQLSARNTLGDMISVRGKIAGKRAIILLRDLGPDDTVDFRGALDALPLPLWIRGPDFSLRWANRAYLDAVNAASLGEAVAKKALIEKTEPQLAEAVASGGDAGPATRYALIEGKRRALSLSFHRLSGGMVSGLAIDTTPLAQAEAQLRLNKDAWSDLLEKIPAGVAIFGKDKRLATYNIRYAQTWDLNPDWLDTAPSLGEILDRLRDMRQLPEQSNYPAWKRTQLAAFEKCESTDATNWHIGRGKSVSVKVCPHLEGGLYFVTEDVTEKLRLEASFKLLTQVQRATLDALDDAIAIFGPDGHLLLHNKSFAGLWALSEEELAAQPHFRKIGALCDARFGQDGIWSIVGAGIGSDDPARCAGWGDKPRADGRTISLAMSRLPNGATVVTFADHTDIERFHAAQREAFDAA